MTVCRRRQPMQSRAKCEKCGVADGFLGFANSATGLIGNVNSAACKAQKKNRNRDEAWKYKSRVKFPVSTRQRYEFVDWHVGLGVCCGVVSCGVVWCGLGCVGGWCFLFCLGGGAFQVVTLFSPSFCVHRMFLFLCFVFCVIFMFFEFSFRLLLLSFSVIVFLAVEKLDEHMKNESTLILEKQKKDIRRKLQRTSTGNYTRVINENSMYKYIYIYVYICKNSFSNSKTCLQDSTLHHSHTLSLLDSFPHCRAFGTTILIADHLMWLKKQIILNPSSMVAEHRCLWTFQARSGETRDRVARSCTDEGCPPSKR